MFSLSLLAMAMLVQGRGSRDNLFDAAENQQLLLPEVPSKLDFDNQAEFAPDNDTQAQVGR